MALSDAYAKREAELANFRRSLTVPSDAVGVAVLHGAVLQGLDLFDRHTTLQYFWESLVDSYAVEWLGSTVSDEPESNRPAGAVPDTGPAPTL